MPDPILDLILRRKSAKSKLSGPSNRTMTMASPAFELVGSDDVVNTQFELDDINTQISSFGFDPDIAESKIGDLPDYTPDYLVRDVLNTDDPVELSRMKSAIKWKTPVVKAIEGIADPISRARAKEEFTFVTNGYQGAVGEKSNYYQNAISSTKAAANIIKKFNGSGDTNEMLKNLRTDSEYGLAQAMLQDPSAQQRWADLGLNPIQGIALDIKEIFEINAAEYKKQLTAKPTDFKAIAEQNIKKAELERLGTSILGGEIDYLLGKKKVAVKKANDFYTENEGKMSKLTETIKADKNLTEEMKSKLSGFQTEYDDAVMGFEGKFVVSPYNFDVLKEKVEAKTANSFEVKEYNNRVGKLNAIVKKYKGEFDQYNQTATQQNAAVREYNKIVNTIQDSYKDVGDYNNLASWAEYLAQKRNTLGARYPEYKQIELEGLVKDIAGDNVGLGEKTVFRLASSIGGEAIDGLNKAWNNLTIWDGDKLREAEMGDAYTRRIEDVMYGYETGDEMLKDERSIIPVAPKDVQAELNKIKNSNLSDEEKYQKNYAIVKKAFDGKRIQYIANPKYGKYNLTAGAILNTVSSVTSQFIGQMAQSYLSGGFGNVSKLRRLLTLFGTTAAQAFSREYDAAVQRGDSNPFEQATTKSFIEGLSELPFDNIQFVKNMSPQFRRLAGDMTEAEWKAMKAGKLPNNIGRQFVGAVESLTKEGALEEGLAQVGGNFADKYLFGKDVDLTEGLDVAMLAGTIGFAPLTLIGLPMKFRSANMGNKLMMYQTGYKADQVIESINQQVADGDITAEEAKQRIESVKLMKEVVGGMSMYDVNGKPLTDNQKAQFAWNEYTKLKAKNIEGLPQQQRQDVEQVVQEADESSSNILNGTDNATYESTRPLQGMPAEGNLEQPQTIGEGQPEQTQTTQPTANVGYSDISGQEVDLQEAPKGLTEVATKVFNDAIQTAKSLMKTGIKVRVFQNQADFERESTKLGQRAMGQGVFSSDGKNILINLSKIKNADDWGIAWHEGTHPVMNIIRNTNPELYDKMAKGFGGLAKQGGVFAQIEGWAQADYGGKTDVSTDEAMVETVALIGDGKIGFKDIPVSFRQGVIDFVNQVADYLGLGQLADTSERVFIQKAAQIAQTLRSGGDISSVVGEQNVQSTQNPFAEKRDNITAQLRDRSSFDFLQGDALSVQSENPNNIYNAIKFADESSFAKNIDFKVALQEKFNTHLKELKKVYGKDFEPLQYNEAVKKFYVDAIREETKKALQDHPEAIGWYDEKTRAALSIISLIHPEIATNVDARASFILPLAITSNGNLVDKNFEYALEQYEYFKENKRYNANGEFGAQQSGIIASLNLMNSILDAGVSMKGLTDYFTTMHKAGNLKFRIKSDGKSKDIDLSGGELVDETVFGASILGPKIGNGFYMNLWGEFNQLTMDRWFMRTWGRLGGTLIDYDKGLVSENKKRVNEALSAIKSNPEAKKILKDVVGSTSGMSVSELANAIKKVSADKVSRGNLANNPLTNELRKASNTLVGNMLGEVELPRNGTERKFIREVFRDVQKNLKLEDNIDITIADLQAVLWYPEKILYDSFQKNKTFEQNAAKYQEGSAPDYQNAAAGLARRRGYTDGQIQDIIRRGQSVRFPDTRGDEGTSQADRTQNKERIFGVVKEFKTKNEEGQERNSSVLSNNNVAELMNTIDDPQVIAGGTINSSAFQSRNTSAPVINVYETKGVAKLPVRSLQDVYNQFGGKAVVINSDPTRVGILKLPSGKTIFMYGGPAYLSVQENVDGNIGFATTQLSKVNTWVKYMADVFGADSGVTFVATQAPTSMLSNSYALRYVMDAISMLPKEVLNSQEFKSEFFGNDLVLLRDAFGEKGYEEFVAKYKDADLSNAEVIDGMIAEMGYKVGDNNKPASFKARGAFVANLLGGISAKASLKGVEGDAGYISKKPNKFISKQLMDRLGINAEKLMRDIGEPSLVDLYMNEGKWGFAVAGFDMVGALPKEVLDAHALITSNPENKEYKKSFDKIVEDYIVNFQSGGVKHPLFNAKFPGKDAFLLDGAYEINKMFTPIEITSTKGNPYTKTAAQMLAGSMYVKGAESEGEGTFEYTAPEAAGRRIQMRNSSVFAAPFYDLSLRDQPGNYTDKADAARETEAYQQYENNINGVAQLLGITLEDVENLIGGFENEQGKKIVEVAAKSNIEVDDFNKAIQFAAILGAIAPETQESTIAARYVLENSPEHNANEHTLKVSDVDLAIQALTDIGVYNFSVNENTNEVTILNIFAYPTNNIDDILDNFASKLKEYGVKYEAATNAALQSEYIDYNRRKEIIADLQGTSFYGQAGQRLRDVIVQAEQRNEKFIRSKQGQSRRSAVVLAEMDSIVADAKANGSYLIAPNEMPTKLTPDQWAETRTQNFKNWFGDWENDPDNASKVVDENGEPLVVYHGFTEGAVDRFKDVSYFAYDKDVADTYGEESSGALPYYISLKNPLVLKSGEDTKALFDNSGASAMSSPFYPNKQLTAAKWVADNGYDGIMVTPKAFEGEVGYIETEGTFGNPQIVTTKGNQIKSAIDNTGRFSTTDNRMQERKSAVEYEKDGDFYIPTNVEMPKGFRIVSDEGYEGWGYLYDNNGQLLDGLGSVKDHIKTIKDRYPVGTKELKDATTLDILSNVDRFTTKQLAFIMSKEDPNGTYLDDYKMINKAASVSAANKLEEEYLSQVRDAAKKYFKESLTDDSYDDIRGYDVPADGLGAETIIKNNPNNSATDNKNQNRNSASKINLAPNGKPSKLTPKQYEQVRTPQFKNWFGDWENDPENSSKVVDKETGEPLVVFHGSVASDIEVFDRDLSKRQSSGLREMGYYFTTNKDLAGLYSEATPKEGALNADGKIYEAFLNLKKVKEFDAKGKNGIRAWDNLQVDAGYKLATNRDAMDFLMNGKFGVDQVDGIIARNITDMESYGAKDVNEEFKGTVYLVFDDKKNSIKSATDNTGAFSTTDNRIQKRESSAAESITVYHGGGISSNKDIDDSVPFFVTENKTEAELYAKGNSGNVSTFKLSSDKIAGEDLARNILRNLGFSEDELMYGVHEFVDPRFEESYIGKENVDELFRLIKNAGFAAVRFTDAGLGAKKYVENILLVDPKNTIENSGVAQLKSSSVQLLNDAIQNRKSAAQITSKAVDNVKDIITRLGYGHLPEDVQERLKKKQRLIDADMNDMNVLSQRLEDAVKAYYGVKYKKLDDGTKALLDKALRNFEGLTFREKMAEQAKIPDSVFIILEQMRASVDAMSLKLIDIGVLDDSLEPAFDGDKGLGVYLNRTYQKYDDPEWINKIPEPVRNRAIEYLKANTFVRQFDDQGDEIDERELTDGEVEGLVNYIATNMQPVNEGLASANAGKTKVDILKGRKIIPEEIRDLMGEYKDPMVNFARSIAKMANLVHTHQALKAIAETNMGTLFFERPTGENFTPIAGEGKTYLQPLSGLFTTPEIAEAFKQVSANFEGDDINLWFLRTLASINGIAKVGKTALSPASWVRNVIGGHIIMLKDGHLFGSGYADGWGKALGYFVNKSKDDPAFQAKIREYIEMGILGDGVQSGEFQAIVRAAQKHDSPVEWLKNDSMLGKGINLVKGFYSAQDDIFRVYAYENEKARLAKRKKNMSEAQLQAEASRKARATYPTYSELPEIVRQLAKFIPISSFPAFSAELIRTTKNSFKIAFEEIGDPDMRDVGIKRLAGVISAISFGSILSGLSSMLVGVDGEEEKNIRRYMPEWSKNSPLIWLGRDDNGMPKYIDLGFSDVFSYFKKPVVALRNEDNEMTDRIKNAVGEIAAPFISPEIFLSAMIKGTKKLKETDDLDEVMGKYAGPVYEALEPGLVASLRRIGKGFIGDVDRYGQQYDPKLELLAFFSGQRIKKMDVPVGFSFKSRDFMTAKRDIMSGYYTERAKTEGDPEKQAKELADANKKLSKYFDGYKKDYDAALGLMTRNMTAREAKKILKNTMKDRNIPNDFIKAIEKNKPYPIIEDDK